MKSSDRFLLGLVVGIVVLVVVSLVVVLRRPAPDYREEDTPAGVAHNYLLALQQGEFDRAYGYLSPQLQNYPADVETYREDLARFAYRSGPASEISLVVGEAEITGSRAQVQVDTTQFSGGGLFDSGQYTSSFSVTLRREDGAWKIIDADGYTAWCWDSKDGCVR